jgi:hypothetical protein
LLLDALYLNQIQGVLSTNSRLCQHQCASAQTRHVAAGVKIKRASTPHFHSKIEYRIFAAAS